jgi:hypothetical protein
MTLIQGGVINGQMTDPLTFLMHALSERFAALGDEIRLTSITELFGFSRSHPGERVDELLVRFDVARQKAQEYGMLTLSPSGLAWLLLKACQVSEQQLLQLLQPFQGAFPQTEADLNVLRTQLRRMGHVLEHRPGNIASALRTQQGRSAYLAQASDDSTSRVFHTQDGDASAPLPYQSALDSAWGIAEPPAQQVWLTEEQSDNGTDTDTDSSVGETPYVGATPDGDTDPQAVAEHLFWAYTRAKAQWRKFVGKPNRAVRRYARRFIKGKGKGGKGKGRLG